MVKYLLQIQSVQQRTSSLLKQLEAVQASAVSNKFPYDALKPCVREYVKATAVSARAAVNAAASALQIQLKFIHSPVTPLNDQRLQRHFRKYATDNNLEVDEVARAAFAYAEVHLRVATYVIHHLEACIDGEQTIEGRAVVRGKMWDK